MTSLAKSILTTLAFFDAQDLPLTLLEVRNYSVHEEGLLKIEQTLRGELQAKVGHDRGFYFLRGREGLPQIRLARYRTSLGRLRKCRRYLWALRFFPYLRAVAISGSQALLGSGASSDIDLFVITKGGRIWLTRLLLSLYFQLLGQRRYRAHVKGRFCLNHYLCAGLIVTRDRNLYTAAEYASLLPVLGETELGRFCARNAWVRDFLPSAAVEGRATFFGFEFSRLQKYLESALDRTLAPALNRAGGVLQKRRIRRQEHILVSDDELSFHPGSRGQRILAKFALTKAQIGL